MPGTRAILRADPNFVLDELEREGQENMPLLRGIVERVFDLGPSLIGDPNKTRALAIHALDADGRRTPQFFAILTSRHKGLHKSVGPRGFSIQVAFRKDAGVDLAGTDWESRFDYPKQGNQVWWRNDLRLDTELDTDSIVAMVLRARETFVGE
jgi:hypothetical protein